ncbi:hypothetical protein BJ165DRAFT_229193 [Panaeolus papilionaceus]|nr:hypothetical protein BJ165DRAFT_229193 [Panaeolus papilionaceus]
MKNAAQQDLDGPIQKLYHNSSPAAAFNSRNRLDSPKCHPKTRIRLLDAILNWADDGSPRIMWLYGAAGAGKSTISQTVCEEICAGSNLAASFFFSRMAPVECHCGHEGGFVATIAYQLTVAIPGLRRYVEQVILTRPSVFALAIREQVLALILNPLSRLIHDKGEDNNFPQPRIIIVDGLDECREEASQEQVLDAITTLVQHQDIFPFSVFLSSRPVPVIHSWFSATEAKSPTLVQRISLQDHCDGDRDIEMFFMDQAADIRQSHPFRDKIPVNWPSPVLAKEVAQRASGKIVYASTVMKYVKDPRHHPHHRLMSTIHDKIATPDRPNLELDTLYLHILRQTKHPRLVHRILAFQMTTLPFYNTLSDNYSKENICSFLSLSGDVDALFVDLDPILNYGINRERAHPVVPTRTMFYHQSFPDFLLDLQRSEEFYVDIQRFDNEFCEISLDHICSEFISSFHF